ncbi:MAG: tetratricopeptide repeat protein [Thermoanaerobaculia bacterium]|nr:tetratricopeptide repeat protein [Thermoanaerobaculia bacterium]
MNPDTGREVPVEIALEREQPLEVAGQMVGAALLSSPSVPEGRYWLEVDGNASPNPRRILVELVGGEDPATAAVEEAEAETDLAGDLEPEEVERRYRDILEKLRPDTMPASARALADLEIAATSRQNADRQMKTLSKIEENVLQDLGRSSPGALLPALYLHVLLDGEYMRRGDAWRMGHHRFRLESFVGFYLRRTRSQGARSLAAKILALMGRPQEALEIAPREELALLQLGMAAERQGRHHQARDYFRRLVETRPSHDHGRLRLAIALRRTGDPAGARTHFSRVARGTGPGWTRSLAYQELAELEFEARRSQAAVTLLRQALEGLDDQALYLQLAYYLDQRGERSEAFAVLNAMPVEPRADEAASRYRYNLKPEAEKAAALGALESAVTTHLPDLRVAVSATAPDDARGSR